MPTSKYALQPIATSYSAFLFSTFTSVLVHTEEMRITFLFFAFICLFSRCVVSVSQEVAPSPAADSTAAAAGLHPDCPAWLKDYIIFHAENKYSETAKYLYFKCIEGSCSGLADRLRGLMWTLRTAVKNRRILLLNQTIPAPMETFLEPALINWRLDARLQEPQDSRKIHDTPTQYLAPFEFPEKWVQSRVQYIY